MEKIVIKEDEEIEIANVDGDLVVADGATVTVSDKVEHLKISGDLISKGDVVIVGSVHARRIRHQDGYLEIAGDVKIEEVHVSSGRMSNGSKLIVTGDLESDKTNIEGGLEVEKNFTCDDVEIRGSCYIHGEAEVGEYEVSGSAKHNKNLRAKEVEVNGSLKVEENVVIEDEFEISGSAKIGGSLESPVIQVGGSFVCGELITRSIDIGGSTKVESARIEERIDVGGSFNCEGSLVAPKVACGGSCKFGDDSEIGILTINGSTKVGAEFKFEQIEVNGSFTLESNAYGDTLEINGSCTANGIMQLKQNLEIDGAYRGDNLEADEIRVAGSLTCEKAKARYILVEHNSRVRGTLIAEEVDVEDGARVEHIIADKVKLGADTRVSRIEAKSLDADPSARYTPK